MPRRATVTRTYSIDIDESFDGDDVGIREYVDIAIANDEPEQQVRVLETRVVEVQFIDDEKNVENLVKYLEDVINSWSGVGPVEVRNYPSGSSQMLFKFNGTQIRVQLEAL